MQVFAELGSGAATPVFKDVQVGLALILDTKCWGGGGGEKTINTETTTAPHKITKSTHPKDARPLLAAPINYYNHPSPLPSGHILFIARSWVGRQWGG